MKNWFNDMLYEINPLHIAMGWVSASRMAKYWTSKEMAKEILEFHNYYFYHNKLMDADEYSEYRRYYSYLSKLLKKEWFR